MWTHAAVDALCRGPEISLQTNTGAVWMLARLHGFDPLTEHLSVCVCLSLCAHFCQPKENITENAQAFILDLFLC